jgi:hypothetical protein
MGGVVGLFAFLQLAAAGFRVLWLEIGNWKMERCAARIYTSAP